MEHIETPIRSDGRIIYAQDDLLIAVTAANSPNAKEIASGIVRAVNAHASLVDALEMIRDADDDCARDGLPTIPAPARAKIDAALAKAKA